MKEVFPIVPAGTGVLYFFGAMSLVMLGLIAFFGWFAYGARHMRAELVPQGLRIRGAVYGRVIPASDLAVGGMKLVDLLTDREYQLVSRRNGSNLPNFYTGWYRLRNREKALVFVTDRRRVVYLPTRAGYALLLSVADPIGFQAAVRRMAGV